MAHLLPRYLQARLLLAMLVVVLIPTGTIAAYSMLRAQAILIDETLNDRLGGLELRAASARRLVAGSGTDLLFLVQSTAASRYLSVGDGAPLAELLLSTIERSQPLYHKLCLVSLSGPELICAHRGADGAAVLLPDQLRDQAGQAWFSLVRSHTRESGLRPITVAPVEPLAGHGPALRSAVLLRDRDGEGRGILMAEIRIEALLSPGGGGRGRLILLHPDGQLVYDSQPGQATRVGDLLPTSAARILGGPAGALFAPADQQDGLVAFTHIQIEGQAAARWTLVEILPAAPLLGQIRETWAVIGLITLAALLGAALVATMVSRSISQPVAALAGAAAQVGAGRLDTPIPRQGAAEISALGEVLDQTVARLRSSLGLAERRRQEAETLVLAAQALTSTLDLGQVLERILSQLRQVVPYDSASLQQLQGDDMIVIGCYGQGWEDLVGHRFSLLEPGRPNTEVVRRRGPLILDDARSSGYAFLDDPTLLDPIRAWMGVPMIIGDRLLGMITLDKLEPGFYTAEHARLAAAFAAQAAVALENARLFAAARQELAERRRAEAELRQAQKMEAIGRLAGGVAHDFNNLLTVILGECDLTLSDPSLPPELRVSVGQIAEAGQRAAALTRQMLAFSRRQVLQPAPLSLNRIIGDMAPMLSRLIGEHISLDVQLDPALRLTMADRGQIEQVLMNLVVNARDAMPAGGLLTIETANVRREQLGQALPAQAAPGDYVLLTVSDTGEGMDAATQAHIFEPFFTTKPRGNGTGLGLATVHGVVTQSGGQIWFESQRGRGSAFHVLLPVGEPAAAGEPAAVAAPPARPAQRRGETILLVEDDAGVRALARQILSRAGFRVLEAASGAAAEQIPQPELEQVDLLLSDVVMPGGVNGAELAQRLQARAPGLRVLLMSGYTDTVLIDDSLAAGHAQFIQKPFTPDELLARACAALGERRP